MKSSVAYPRVKTVTPLAEKKLLVTFSNGHTKIYDCRPLLEEEAFGVLRDEGVFRQVHPDKHGYAVIWNDEIDLAESELWLNGKPAEQTAPTR